MGCDIHPYLEIRRNGVWQSYYGPEPDPYDEGDPDRIPQYPMMLSRNYAMFGLISATRWDPSHTGHDPIAEDRGIPHDCSPEIRELIEDDGDLHSETWFSLRDLLQVEWGKSWTEKGTLGLAQFVSWDGYERRRGVVPDDFIEGRPTPFQEVVSPAEANARITAYWKSIEGLPHDDPVKKQWFAWRTAKYRFQATPPGEELGACVEVEVEQWLPAITGELYLRALPHMMQVAREMKVGVDDVRVVLAYDN